MTHMIENAHEAGGVATDVNVIAWHPTEEHHLLSGGDDGACKVWDARQTATRPILASLAWHAAPISAVQWHPTQTTMFCASSYDDSVTVWDLSLEYGDAEAAGRTADGKAIPPQLLFLHSGQKHIAEVKWHPQIPGMLLSTAEDGFNVFKPENI